MRLLYQEVTSEEPITSLRESLKKLADLEDEIDGHDLVLSKSSKEWRLKAA